MIDDDEAGLVLGDQGRDLLDLAGAQQRRRPRGDEGDDLGRTHVEVDGSGKSDRLLETVLDRMHRRLCRSAIAVGAARRAPAPPQRHQHDGARRHTPALDGTAAGRLGWSLGVRDGYPCCWGSAGSESMRCTGAPGMMVDMACL